MIEDVSDLSMKDSLQKGIFVEFFTGYFVESLYIYIHISFIYIYIVTIYRLYKGLLNSKHQPPTHA